MIPMNREQHREKLLRFLKTVCRADAAITGIDEDISLVEAGLIDSLAIVQIITFLESEYDIDLLDSEVDPAQLYSISTILDVIGRFAA